MSERKDTAPTEVEWPGIPIVEVEKAKLKKLYCQCPNPQPIGRAFDGARIDQCPECGQVWHSGDDETPATPIEVEIRETLRRLIGYAESMYARLLSGDKDDINWKPLQDARDLLVRLNQTKTLPLIAESERAESVKTKRYYCDEEMSERVYLWIKDLEKSIAELEAEVERLRGALTDFADYTLEPKQACWPMNEVMVKARAALETK